MPPPSSEHPALAVPNGSAELARALFAESFDALLLFHPETEQVLDANPAALDLTGLSRSQLLQLPIAQLFRSEVPGTLQRMRVAIRRAVAFRAADGFLIRQGNDDGWIPVDVTACRTQSQAQPVGLIIARDLRGLRAVEQQLQRKEAELRRVLDAHENCVWSMENDPDGRWSMNYCSPVIERITGRPPSYFSVDLQRWQTIVHPEDHDRVSRYYTGVAGKPESVQEYRILRPDGEIRWVRDRVEITALEVGCVRFDGVLEDITEQVRVEQASVAADSEYRDLVETSNDLIWSVDGLGCWTFVNRKAALAIYGYEPQEMLGRPFSEFLAPGQLERDATTFGRIIRGESVYHYETTHLRKDGRQIRLLFNSIPAINSDGRVVGTKGTATDITQKHQAEQALAESRQRFEAFMNCIPFVCFIKDAEGRNLYHNREFQAKFPDAAQGLLGRLDVEYWPAEVAATLRKNDLAVLSGNVSLELREKVPTGDGRMREWYVVKFPFPDAQGRLHLGGVAVDLTERQQAEKELQISEERYRMLFENNLAGVFQSTLDGRLLDCNDSFAHILGFASRDDAMRFRTPTFYDDPVDRSIMLDKLTGSNHLTNYEIRMRRRDGEPVWVIENISLSTDSAGEAVIEGTMIDITERKLAEVALRTSEARYRTLIDNLEECVFLKSTDSTYLAGNQVFCAQIGLAEAELRGKSDEDLFPADLAERFRAADQDVLEAGRKVAMSATITVSGKPRTYRFNRTPVKDDAGNIVGVLGIGWDATDQLALEAQLRHVQKMDAVGQLAGGIAHDFNNFLTIILGNLSVALAQNARDDATLESLRNAERASLSAAELTRSLLGFARRAPMQTVAIDLRNVLEELVRLIHSTIGPRILLEIRSQPNLWMINGDPGQINQVLMNLALNARDAMPQGGVIRFHLSHFVPDADYLRMHVEARPGEFVCVRVEDTGHGIPEEIRQHIFEPFFTTKEKGKGTGLGLAIAFGIVQNHGGWITCQSEPQRGTAFSVFLPRQISKPQLTEDRHEAPTISRAEWTILVIDDEPMIRNMASAILTRAGYRVLLAEDGAKGVEICRNANPPVDLVILDSIMPRLAGRDTLVELSKLDQNVRILFSSGFADDPFPPEEFPQIRGVIPKPYRSEELVEKVRSIIDEARRDA